ncbi:MAG: glucose-6-phosphate dehydrogenase [Chloroflexi bacterium]|nr:glucose-6-phosphate dehydrogenase [Chloroflexota bacterium]
MKLEAPPDQDFVIIGATGNLSRKKLLPAIYNLALDGLLPSGGLIIGQSNEDLNDAEFRRFADDSVKGFSRREIGPATHDAVSKKLRFVPPDRGLDGVRELCTTPERTIYLAIPPSAFETVVLGLKAAGLVEGSRLVIEKPFGVDTGSAEQLDETLHSVFSEDSIFRIDHYLGKETVQNLIAFRFANSIFERIWNRDAIDHVQITVAEDIGVEDRGQFYEEVGALRDIVQNHVLQVLALLAMEPPSSLHPERIRDERAKLMHAVAELDPAMVVRGQYTGGDIARKHVAGYRDEAGVASDSTTETYLATVFHIDNWRWAGVPFFVRAGKRLPRRVTEVQIAFRPAPTACFRGMELASLPDNHLTIRIQPDESISMSFAAKTPGPLMDIQPVRMKFDYGETFIKEPQEAYERLLHDALLGDGTLFLRADAVHRAWEIVQPVLDSPPAVSYYEAGTWGPERAEALLGGRAWHTH